MAKEDRIDMKGDGRIVLYLRDGLKRPIWQIRIRVPNASGYKIVSSKTEDRKEAERFAFNLYEDLYLHVKSGGSIRTKTFRQVFKEWEAEVTVMGSTRQGGSWRGTADRIRSYALEYFGSKKIDSFKRSDFNDYWKWRKENYNRRPPTNGTLKRERTSLLPIFKYAVERGYIIKVPEIDAPKAKTERRSTFTLEEWRVFTRKARQWVKEGQKLAVSRDRFVAQQYFLILANTGMRIGEARGLRWCDLRTVDSPDGTRLVAEITGKTGTREAVFQSNADTYVKRLYDLRIDELGEPPNSDGYVFCHRNGEPIQSFKRAFNSLLKFSGLPLERNGKRRTIYSLRHFYATQRLSNDTSPFLLAKQMGTSVEMLEKFYGQTVNSQVAAQVSKSNQTANSTVTKEYPFE